MWHCSPHACAPLVQSTLLHSSGGYRGRFPIWHDRGDFLGQEKVLL
jgi:hypothetical protein